MIFSKTYRYQSSMHADDIKSRLVGKHVKVHNMDFEIYENDRVIRIIPHAEQEENIKTLPITHVEFTGTGDKTQIVINSKMRKIDSGGPFLILVFCFFLFVAAITMYILGSQEYMHYTYTFAGIGLAIFALFWLRMERGYFDYVRKIRDYIKKQSVV